MFSGVVLMVDVGAAVVVVAVSVVDELSVPEAVVVLDSPQEIKSSEMALQRNAKRVFSKFMFNFFGDEEEGLEVVIQGVKNTKYNKIKLCSKILSSGKL